MVDMPSSLNSTQENMMRIFKRDGIPSKKGESTHVCYLSAEKLKLNAGDKDEVT